MDMIGGDGIVHNLESVHRGHSYGRCSEQDKESGSGNKKNNPTREFPFKTSFMQGH